jgi:hypothetical protein
MCKAQCLHRNTAQEKGASYPPPHFVNLSLYIEISKAENVAIYIKFSLYTYLMQYCIYVKVLGVRMYLL